MILLDLHRSGNPRFAQQPFRLFDPMPWRGRTKKRNRKRHTQAAAKRARKINRRNRK